MGNTLSTTSGDSYLFIFEFESEPTVVQPTTTEAEFEEEAIGFEFPLVILGILIIWRRRGENEKI